MEKPSIMQAYTICVINQKGKIPNFSIEKSVCFIAAGLLEMQLDNCIIINEEKVTVLSELPERKSYLTPLYNFVNQKKSMKISEIVKAYCISFTNKRFNELLNAVEVSLYNVGLIEEVKGGYKSKANAINSVVERIRVELLEDGEVMQDTAALVILLEEAKGLKNYFSESESKEIKQKLQRASNSINGKMIKDMVTHIQNLTGAVAVSTIIASSV